MTQSRVGFEVQAPLLRRLAVVFADPLRLKIVTELYMRPMSPTLFYEEFGGGSVPRVYRHFNVLVKHGWLRHIKSETGGKRYGGVEGFYRAPELAIFDNETWAELPYSMRVEFSATIFHQFGERVIDAMQAGTFDARSDRHFTWTALLLDRNGWSRVTAALNALFDSIFEEQADAKLRTYDSGEKPILTTVGLGGFESPRSDAEEDMQWVGANLAQNVDCPFPFTQRVSKVFADPVCLKIVAELNLRAMSPTQFYREFGGASKSGIHYRFHLLTELGWLRKIQQKSGGTRRGAREQFFRATGPAVFDTASWSAVPNSAKATYSWTIFEQMSEQFSNAMKAGAIDARLDRHLSWSLLLLDQRGWENVIAELDALFAFVLKEQDAAKLRVADTGEKVIRMTVALAGFESPKDAVKAL